MSDRSEAGFGLYVHWPFCLSKCPYCDFNSHVRESIDQVRWSSALLRELENATESIPRDRGPLTSIFFGGGTPSLMAPATAEAIIARSETLWGHAGDMEITLEANPTSVEAGKLADFRAAGVNRVSLGVQALDDESLKALGRQHSAVDALGAVRLAAGLFDRYSFDLIYARPGQTESTWRDELGRALAEAGDHLSLYQLTIEPGTAFHTLHGRGELAIPDEETAATLYETTQKMTLEAGFPAYEVSNHARPGGESRHNLTYWRGGDYVGIGPGAHGRESRAGSTVAVRRHRAPERWLEKVEATGSGAVEATTVSADERIAEILMMGMRLTEGVSAGLFAALTGKKLSEAIDGGRVADLVEAGFVLFDEKGLRTTAEGRQRLNALLAHLLA